MRFEYLAMIGAALMLSEAMGDYNSGMTLLTYGEIFLAVAIMLLYIDVFVEKLKPLKGLMTKAAVGFGAAGLTCYVSYFI